LHSSNSRRLRSKKQWPRGHSKTSSKNKSSKNGGIAKAGEYRKRRPGQVLEEGICEEEQGGEEAGCVVVDEEKQYRRLKLVDDRESSSRWSLRRRPRHLRLGEEGSLGQLREGVPAAVGGGVEETNNDRFEKQGINHSEPFGEHVALIREPAMAGMFCVVR
jgi:hypothetical protein